MPAAFQSAVPIAAARLYRNYCKAKRLVFTIMCLCSQAPRNPSNAPRFQLAPMGYRGYIEARPVEAINV